MSIGETETVLTCAERVDRGRRPEPDYSDTAADLLHGRKKGRGHVQRYSFSVQASGKVVQESLRVSFTFVLGDALVTIRIDDFKHLAGDGDAGGQFEGQVDAIGGNRNPGGFQVFIQPMCEGLRCDNAQTATQKGGSHLAVSFL